MRESATRIPILCAINVEKVTFEDIIVDGNRAANAYIDGCRGGAIYLYEVKTSSSELHRAAITMAMEFRSRSRKTCRS